jgi:spore maturation protein B
MLLLCNGELFSEFVKGASEGAEACFGLLPTLVILLVATGMLRASGAIDVITDILEKPLAYLGIPPEIIPTVILRPLSGSAANASVVELFKECHPDSFAGRCVSVMMGSSDTIVYTMAMYFGSVGIRKSRHAIPSAVAVMIFCTLLSVWLTRLFFGNA